MAKIKEEEKILTPEEIAEAFIRAHEEDCLNFEEPHDYVVPASSLRLTAELGGGIRPGIHRAIGVATGGKTSQSLDYMFHFLKMPNRKAVYVKAEGRLSEEMRLRSGIRFFTHPVDWADGTCLVLECNIYETILEFIKQTITPVNNKAKREFLFVVDSLDSMVRKEDSLRALSDPIKVAGGAMLLSNFLKTSALEISKRGHIVIFISQVRDEIKLNQYEKSSPHQGNSTGGNAIQHGASTVANHLQKYNDDLIREKPEDNKSKIIGVWAKVQLLKTDNEKNFTTVRYPIKNGRLDGNSIWREYEVFEEMKGWEQIKKSGSWFKTDPTTINELKAQNIDIPEQLQGENQWRDWLEKNPIALEVLYKKYYKLARGL